MSAEGEPGRGVEEHRCPQCGTFIDRRGCMSAPTELETLHKRHSAAVGALMQMFEQYCSWSTKTAEGKPMFHHMFMSAGEDASEVLEAEGRISGDQMAVF